MSVVHNERAAHPVERGARLRTLLRRLMITCPTTGRPADTGFELMALSEISSRQQILVDCLECGQDHEWRVEDAFLD
jgi:hypothetical protein